MIDESYMRLALEQAELARQADEVPVGCVIVEQSTGNLLASACNRRETDEDPTGHAEIVALRMAARSRGHWRLDDCTLYVTLEPCPMCAGAVVNARIARVVFGCTDPKAGAVRTLYQICDDGRLNHRAEVTTGVLTEECAAILKAFFQSRRAMGRK